jgi:hypothetical protein
MPTGRNRTLQSVQRFILKSLPHKIKKDLQNLRIVKEADLECACYFHIRKYIGEDAHWRMFARKHSQRTGHFIDLLIFKKYKPRIAIELKWNALIIDKKDRRSLGRAVAKLGSQKAYWISATFKPVTAKPFQKRAKEKYRVHARIVGLDYINPALADWKKKRALYLSKMAIGKGTVRKQKR